MPERQDEARPIRAAMQAVFVRRSTDFQAEVRAIEEE